jgi:hypothetical protein
MTAAGGPREVPGNGGNGHKKANLQLRVPESLAGGTYTNSMMVHHSADEFVMDFVMATGGNGQVVARVITSPVHMKRIVAALADNLKKYESAHGTIEPRGNVE